MKSIRLVLSRLAASALVGALYGFLPWAHAQGTESQTLTWTDGTASIIPLHTPHPLSATASSGLPVTYSVNGPATFEGGLLTATRFGTITVTAEQAGNATLARVSETRTFNRREVVLTPRGSNGSANLTFDVDVSGHLAFTADWGAGLQIVDVANPAGPVRVGLFNTPGQCFGVHVVGNLAYVADGTLGLHILDITNPANPTSVGEFRTGGNAQKVQVVGTVAYVAAVSADLQVIDVTDPKAPVRLAEAEHAGVAIGLKVVGNYAYVAAGGSGLHVFNVSTPASPVLVATLGDLGEVSDLDVADGRACLVSSSGLQVIDVSTPSAPVRLGGLNLFVPGPCCGGVFLPGLPATFGDVQIVGDLAYVINEANLQVIDLSDPTQPSRLGTIPTASDGKGVKVVGSTVYVADTRSGLRIVNVEVGYPQTVTWTGTSQSILPLNQPQPLSATASSGLPVTVRVVAGPATLADGQITITGPGTVSLAAEQPGDAAYLPTRASLSFNLRHTQLSSLGASPRTPTDGLESDLEVVGHLAYVVARGTWAESGEANGALRIVDVSQRAAPVTVGRYASAGSMKAVHVAGSYAYLAAGNEGLEIVDVSNPTNPQRVGRYAAGGVNAVAGVGNRVYVTSASEGFLALDVSDPTSPLLLGKTALASVSDGGLKVAGDFAYVTSWTRNLHVVDISNPSAPAVGARVAISGFPTGLRVAGNHVYVAQRPQGQNGPSVEIFDLTRPANPAPAGAFSGPDLAVAIEVAGNHAFLGDNSGGFVVVDVTNPAQPQSVGSLVFSGSPTALRAVGHYIYAVTYSGLRILEMRLGYPQSLSWTGVSDTIPTLLTPHPLNVVASSGLPVSVTVEFGPADLAGGNLTISSAGLVQVTAEQSGDASNLPVRETRHFNSRSPQLTRVGELSADIHDARAVTVRDSRAYLGDYGYDDFDGFNSWITLERAFRILDVSDPARPVQLGALPFSGRIEAIEVVGNLAYLADYGADGDDRFVGGGLRIVDVSDPTKPVLMGGLTTDAGTGAVQIAGHLAYVADWGALRVFDVSNPTNVTQVGRLDVTDGVYEARVVGNYAYYGEGSTGLAIADVSNPANPVRVGRLETMNYVRGLEIVGNLAYIVSGVSPHGLLEVADISQPNRPVMLGRVSIRAGTESVRVLGDTAYVAAWDGGLVVVDVSNPAHPVVLGSQPTDGVAAALDRVGDLAYVASGSAGLQVIEVQLVSPRVGGPSLRVTAAGGQVELTWPATLTTARLQRSDSLAPGQPWQDVTAASEVADGQLRVRVEASGVAGYFRLLLP